MKILSGNANDAEEKATKLLLQAAEDGTANAQYAVATRYLSGPHDYLPKDLEKALFWLKQAAHQDHVEAQSQLGLLYLGERGVLKNAEQALFWLQKSAALNNASAQAELGRLYLQGQGVAQDTARGLAFYHNAAAQQHGRALRYLGNYYAELAPSDHEQALSWYQQAAEQADQEAMFYLAELYRQGQGAAQDHGLAYHWYRQSAIYPGHKFRNETDYQLGLAYLNGRGTALDYESAQESFLHAAVNGYGPAAYAYVMMFHHGLGVEQDLEDVYMLACVAVLQGYDQAKEVCEDVGKNLSAINKVELERSAVEINTDVNLIK